MNVACIGVGTIGRSWALAFAKAGCSVKLFDSSPLLAEKASRWVERRLLEEQPGTPAPAAARTLEEAVQNCSYVQESIAEDVDEKRVLFERLDLVTLPSAILASSTSELAPSSFTYTLIRRERCLVAHPTNPPDLVPLVEICGSPWTHAAVIEDAKQFLTSIGQTPIEVKKEVSGFVLNRLQMALLGEALHIVGEGICSAADVDKAVKHGLGMRWALMGPFETAHLNSAKGFADYMTKFGAPIRKLIATLEPSYDFTDDLLNRIEEEVSEQTTYGTIEEWQADRDHRLRALKNHLDRSSRSPRKPAAAAARPSGRARS